MVLTEHLFINKFALEIMLVLSDLKPHHWSLVKEFDGRGWLCNDTEWMKQMIMNFEPSDVVINSDWGIVYSPVLTKKGKWEWITLSLDGFHLNAWNFNKVISLL